MNVGTKGHPFIPNKMEDLILPNKIKKGNPINEYDYKGEPIYFNDAN